MALIQVKDLTFSYPGSYDTIFDHVSFQIDTNWKLGFVGRNGRGKTTFLMLLLGRYAYEGSIRTSVSFDYFPYAVEHPEAPTEDVLREVCPEAEDWEFLRELNSLEVEEAALHRPFNTLSHGEQTKALLAALFLKEGNFLLIDEPTNHLDLRGRALVSAYLKRKRGFILVSHDRAFLDGCVDHILSLNRADIQVCGGNFSTWFETFSQQQRREAAQDTQLKKEIRNLQASARRTADWSDRVEASKFGQGPVDRGYIGAKSAKMMKRAKTIEARRQQAAEERSSLLKNAETAEALKLFPVPYHAARLLTCRDVAPVYHGRAIAQPVTFTLERGDRIALTGKNGSGKSSLLRLLLEPTAAHTGTITVGSGLICSVVPQDASWLRGSLQDFIAAQRLEESLFKAILRKLDFSRAQFEKPMEDYSAGQKKKVLLARSLCQRAHLYLWDEPLNYIDLYSRMQLETLLLEFTPTMVLVEHDSAFLDAVATKRLTLQPLG